MTPAASPAGSWSRRRRSWRRGSCGSEDEVAATGCGRAPGLCRGRRRIVDDHHGVHQVHGGAPAGDGPVLGSEEEGAGSRVAALAHHEAARGVEDDDGRRGRGYWHVWMRGPQSAATDQPLPGDLVPALLEEWGFAAEQCRHWEVDPQPTNPGLRERPTIRPPSAPKPKQGYVSWEGCDQTPAAEVNGGGGRGGI